MSSLQARLSQAHKEYRSDEFSKALKLFQEIKNEFENENIISNSIEFFIQRCNENIGCKSLNSSKEKITNQNNVILLINPSHHHEEEVKFWKSFIDTAFENNFLVIDLNFRSIEPFSNNITLVNPARSFDLSKKFRILTPYENPKWLNEQDVKIYDDWEHRRWQIKKYDFRVRIGLENTAKYINNLVLELKPAAIMSSNKIDWPNRCGYKISQYYGIKYFFIERSPFDSHLIEHEGMFAESNKVERILNQIRSSDTVLKYQENAKSIIQSLTSNPYGFRADEALKESYDEIDFEKEIIFFLPLDNILWTAWGLDEHEQSSIDYPVYNSPKEALKNISKVVKKLGAKLVVKPHPSCKEWEPLQVAFPEVKFTNADLKVLIEKSDVILTFLTKVSYVSMAFKKPTVSFGTGLLDSLGITYEVKHNKNLKRILETALSKKGFDEKYANYVNVLPLLDELFFSSGIEAFDFIKNFISSGSTLSIEKCEKVIKELTSQKKLDNILKKKKEIKLKIDKHKPCVLFDITRLLNANLKYSGINRYAYELALFLSKNTMFNFIPIALPQNNNYGMSAKVFIELEKVLNTNILPIERGFEIAEELGFKYIYHSPLSSNFISKRSDNCIPVITVHDIFHLTMPETYDSKNYITHKIVEDIDVDETNVIFNSEFSKKQLNDYLKKLIKSSTVTHLGISNEYFSYNPLLIDQEKLLEYDNFIRNKQFIVIPFQNDPRKNFQRMIEIAKLWIGKDSFNRKAIVIGSNSKKVECLKVLKNDESFYYLSDLNDSELAYVYRQAICHLYLSKAEGFGMPPLEAMAGGCPSIMLKNTAMKEVYSGWSLLLDNDVSNEIILNYLDNLAVNSAYNVKKKLEAMNFAKKFTWNHTCIETLKFYSDLLFSKEISKFDLKGKL